MYSVPPLALPRRRYKSAAPIESPASFRRALHDGPLSGPFSYREGCMLGLVVPEAACVQTSRSPCRWEGVVETVCVLMRFATDRKRGNFQVGHDRQLGK